VERATYGIHGIINFNKIPCFSFGVRANAEYAHPTRAATLNQPRQNTTVKSGPRTDDGRHSITAIAPQRIGRHALSASGGNCSALRDGGMTANAAAREAERHARQDAWIGAHGSPCSRCSTIKADRRFNEARLDSARRGVLTAASDEASIGFLSWRNAPFQSMSWLGSGHE